MRVGKGEGPDLVIRAFAARAFEHALAEWHDAVSARRLSSRSVREWRCVGRTVWAVFGLRSGGGILRELRVFGGAVPRVRAGATPRGAWASQSRVVSHAARAGVGPGTSGALPRPKSRRQAARNGHDLFTSGPRGDTARAVELRRGAFAP